VPRPAPKPWLRIRVLYLGMAHPPSRTSTRDNLAGVRTTGSTIGLSRREPRRDLSQLSFLDEYPKRLALVRGVSRGRGVLVRRRAARVGSRGVLLCGRVIAGLMVDGGEVMTLGGRQVVLGRGQVVLRSWMLNGHIGLLWRYRPAARGSLAAHRVAVSAALDRPLKPADLVSHRPGQDRASAMVVHGPEERLVGGLLTFLTAGPPCGRPRRRCLHGRNVPFASRRRGSLK